MHSRTNPDDYSHHNHIIIGAGLSGLTLAYKLNQQGRSFIILEARGRAGGRIHTITSAKDTPIDMGATWFGMKHQHLVSLLDELELPYFEQFMKGTTLFEPISFAPAQKFDVPPGNDSSYRIAGGTSALIDTLTNLVGQDKISFNQRVVSISNTQNELEVTTQHNQYIADKVISTLPPKLLMASVEFNPSLPEDLIKIARNTDIWMGDSIKCGLSYPAPFWREADYSGTAFSNVGPFTELYDHSNYEENKFALKGFLQPDMHKLDEQTRKEQVVQQLTKFFGAPAKDFLAYKERLWREEAYTFSESTNFIPPHAHNGHQIYDKAFMDGRLFISGSETSSIFGGYMEGAVASTHQTLSKMLKLENTGS